jgi:hypothetical protein
MLKVSVISSDFSFYNIFIAKMTKLHKPLLSFIRQKLSLRKFEKILLDEGKSPIIWERLNA